MLAMPAPITAPPAGARQEPESLAARPSPPDVSIIATASDSAVRTIP
ncbi:hypothetical protein ACVILK_004759 [Bradyrhizobium embrapense]